MVPLGPPLGPPDPAVAIYNKEYKRWTYIERSESLGPPSGPPEQAVANYNNE